MTTRYELHDTETHNIVAGFANEDAALVAVREMLREDGHQATATLLLLAVDEHGDHTRWRWATN